MLTTKRNPSSGIDMQFEKNKNHSLIGPVWLQMTYSRSLNLYE